MDTGEDNDKLSTDNNRLMKKAGMAASILCQQALPFSTPHLFFQLSFRPIRDRRACSKANSVKTFMYLVMQCVHSTKNQW